MTGPTGRIALPTANLWAVLLAVQLTRWPVPPVPGLLVGGCALAVGVRAMRSTRLRLVAGGLALTGLALGLVVASGVAARTQPASLRGPVAAGASARAVVQLTSDPQPIAGGPGGPSYRASARAHEITTRGLRIGGRIPLLLLGPNLGEVQYGSVVSVTGRLAQPRAGSAETALLRVSATPLQLRGPGTLARATNRVRAAAAAAVKGIAPDPAALILGLAIGDESQVPTDLRTDMVRAGLAHLTAVSGSNTTMIMGLAIGIAAWLGIGWRGRVLIAGLSLTGFVLLVRPQPSVLRAAAMGVVMLLVLARGGRRDGVRALAGAAGALLVVLPSLASSLGFAMSVAATAGLLVMADRIESGLATGWGRWLPPPVVAGLALTMGAAVATLPLTVGLGNGLSLVSLPANLAVVPLVPPVTILGLGAALIGVFLESPAHLLALCAAPFAGGIAAVARWAANLPGGVIPLPGGWTAALSCAAVLLMALGLLRIRRVHDLARRWTAWATGLAVVAWLLGSVTPAVVQSRRWPPPDWLLVSCDVGQGDATVIRVPGPGPPVGVVIDTGPEPGAMRRCLDRLRLAGVAAVVLTHAHADHIGGLSAIASRWPAAWPKTPLLVSGSFGDLGPGVGGVRRPVGAGAQLALPGLQLAALWPARVLPESEQNNSSLVLLATIAGPATVRVLLTGDIEDDAQVAVMARTGSLVADVLKVPHHGSPRQAPGFAQWTHARLALVSVGAGNDYGHPAPGTLAQLAAAGMVVGRTDTEGGLAVVVRDGTVRLVPERPG